VDAKILESYKSPDAALAVRVFVAQSKKGAALMLEACVHCGQCADACHFYQASRDPRHTPVYKLRPMLKAYEREAAPFSWVKRMLGLAPAAPGAEELTAWSELLYDSCNLCGRCTLVCPMGIDIAALVRRAREAMSAAGFAPEDMYKAAGRAIESGSPIGVRWPALRRQIELQEQETGLKIPVDVEGAEYMVILSSIETIGFPEVIGALARIFRHVGATWTIPSAGFEATNIGVQIGSREVAAELVSRVVAAAERLRAQQIPTLLVTTDHLADVPRLARLLAPLAGDAAAGDSLALAIITVIGFASHRETNISFIPRMFTTFIPLVVSWFLIAPWLGLLNPQTTSDPKQLWRPLLAMLLAAPITTIFRAAMLNGVALPLFTIILGGSAAFGMFVWRMIWYLTNKKSLSN